jgi:glucokinase
MLLAGDIGGTKTSLAIYSPERGPRAPLADATFPSAAYPSLEALLREFLASGHWHPRQAVFGVAGPVVAGQASITNLPWVMEEAQLQAAFGLASVRLLNDLAAIAQAVPWLGPDDLHTLNQGQKEPGGAIAVIAPGTGLGESFLTWDGTRYHAQSSEGGHTDFAPVTPLEVELLRYLMGRYDHVSYERVCSGIGLPNIYAFLKDSGYAPEPDWMAARLAGAADPTPIIVKAALDSASPALRGASPALRGASPALRGASPASRGARPCELCAATLRTFVSILGTEAGNVALKVMATGGVYLGGGIPPRILPALHDPRFMQAFQSKGRMATLLARVPVHVILNPQVALLGAAYYGLGE